MVKKISEEQATNKMLLSLENNEKLFRNNVGSLKTPSGGFIHFGLGNTGKGKGGSPDFIGWTEIEITQDMVGLKLPIFTAIEVKSSCGTLTENQIKWRGRLMNAGAIYKIFKGDKYVQSDK